jgi:YidC/Oxa1 family membrane protein insertase
LNIWELIIQQPLTNVLIVVSHFLGDSFGLAIIALTVVINLAMLPMTLSQIRSTKAMQDLQPKLSEIQKKYSRDKQKLSQEQMKLYKESGVKPAGCAVSMLIQMPVWIALYQSIMLALAVAPEGLLSLTKYLYSWDILYSVIPLNRDFLLLNLAQPNIILAVLVGATMWMQQKMTTVPSPDPKQAQQAQMMLWMMPMMFTFFALSFPSGLALYWVVNSLARIVIQWRMTGIGGLRKQPAKIIEGERKPLKFEVEDEKKTNEKTGADIVISDTQGSNTLIKPNKQRYLPGKDREQHRRKK